jgi:hypothetical protein
MTTHIEAGVTKEVWRKLEEASRHVVGFFV